MSVGDFIGQRLSCLGINCEPQYFTLSDYWILTILLWIKSNLVVEDENEFVFEEFGDLRVTFAIRSISAQLQLNVEEWSFVWVEVTEQIQVVFISAHHFLSVKLYFWIAWAIDWMEFTDIFAFKTQLFVRAWMWGKFYSAWVIASIVLRPPKVMIEDELAYRIIKDWLWIRIVGGQGGRDVEPFIEIKDIVWVKLGVWYCW